MQDENRFFRFLGRMNAILLGLCALGVLLMLGFFAFDALRWRAFAPPAPQHAAGLGPKGAPDVVYDFAGDFSYGDATALEFLDGSGEALLVLKRESGEVYDSLSRGPTSANVNILIIDTATARTRWMFAGVKRDIGTTVKVHAAPGDTGSVIALLMQVADADSNGDKEISGNDYHSLYLYRPGDTRAIKLLAAQSISSVHQTDPGHVLVTYSDGKDDRVVIFDTASFKAVAQNVIGITPN